ncbi:5'-methylthioadenosine/adenosylhomocysteine nucleosidase [Halosquirtibacter xylanolyticus]|uniref:5'-methylthioadenosine/adenosylhomocysteine nucleosidase n=1 Tax=Halosquirtibacter xylanolyticus TaxID=3374599 RepID=UPI003748D52F|nr:5'-methylthioadenosine/adenosylhomocysteine nucleosidase [Prolixibacteraceae bacterium]
MKNGGLFLIIFFYFIFSCTPSYESGRVAIVGAMPEEIKAISNKMENIDTLLIHNIAFIQGLINHKKVVILKCGVGKVNAAMTTTLLIDHFHPEYILFTGIAGAIDEKLVPGDIVIGTQYIQHDLGTLQDGNLNVWAAPNVVTEKDHPLFIKACPILEKKARGQFSTTENCYFGTIATGDQFIADNNKKKLLSQAYNAYAVDMESAAIAQVCLQFNTPFIIFRSISDSANENAEETYYFNKQKSADRTVDMLTKLL